MARLIDMETDYFRMMAKFGYHLCYFIQPTEPKFRLCDRAKRKPK
jgi:hypothetical protein